MKEKEQKVIARVVVARILSVARDSGALEGLSGAALNEVERIIRYYEKFSQMTDFDIMQFGGKPR